MNLNTPSRLLIANITAACSSNNIPALNVGLPFRGLGEETETRVSETSALGDLPEFASGDATVGSLNHSRNELANPAARPCGLAPDDLVV
jgi:hypothetical protein